MSAKQGHYLIEVHPFERSGRGRWWGPRRRGYTNRLEEAGVYHTDDDTDGLPFADGTNRIVFISDETAEALTEVRTTMRMVRGDVKSAAEVLEWERVTP